MKEEEILEFCRIFKLEPKECDGKHPKYGCDLEKLNFVKDLIFFAKVDVEMMEGIKRYDQAKEDKTLDKHFPKL